MIQVLVKLKDLLGAEICFREWESRCSTYDIRVANVLIGKYAEDDLLEKAKELKERARRRGANPNAKTWEIFLQYYLKNEEFGSAVECVANAISVGRGDGRKWIPPQEIVNTFMGHFEKKKDVEGVEDFLDIVGFLNNPPTVCQNDSTKINNQFTFLVLPLYCLLIQFNSSGIVFEKYCL